MIALLAAALLLAWPAAAPARAATIAVNTTSDAAPLAGECSGQVGDCSLRQAIDTAQPGDKVQLGGSAGAPATYGLTLGSTLEVAKNITIEGDGPRATIVDGSQNRGGSSDERFRLMKILGATVSISGIAFAGAADAHDENLNPNGPSEAESLNGGGAIFNDGGAVSLSDVAFSDNSGSDNPIGGAVSNGGGTLSMTGVSFSGDGAGEGGGLLVRAGKVTGLDVTFAGERGEFGGGAVLVLGGTLELTDSTVVESGEAASIGGGIDNRDGTVRLLSDTLSGNDRGSLETDKAGAVTSAEDTIIGAGFSDGGDCAMPPAHDENGDLVRDAITEDRGHNIDEDGSCGLTGSGDQHASAALAPLADNGGEVETQALLSGSAALDAGDDACPAEDARGVARPQGSGCDVGAFEAVVSAAQEPPAAPTPPGTPASPVIAPPTSPPSPTIVPPSPTITARLVLPATASVAAGRAALKLRCGGTAGAHCQGGLRLTADLGRSKRKRTAATIGSAPYDLGAGRSGTLEVKLSAAALKRLRRGALKAMATAGGISRAVELRPKVNKRHGKADR